ncbi:hypothetical protein HWQ46_23745 [Shewanella sp. D64]|uniref:hypothetical protein n=1 Tax=unclassified Shewanella TaxID=196818 RepID=UPI0022BA616C|nr:MULTISPECIES: hypothetical protein [unclassified Shewanella]MEC4728540.1 hypothetical protein [Shewanella sp. D64]MEC4740544.1 hypothetical protein [Shewanella sp. E94]WBJ94261.1 hypothetical protein HWQ47_20575 [Shewanella sp. MTB7]
MKRLISSVAIALLFSAGAVANNWSSHPDERPDGQTQFNVDLTGEVPQRCMMYSTQDKSIELDVKVTNSVASEFTFQAWCNNDNSKGTLVVGAQAFTNSNGTDVIPLEVSFNGTTSTIDKTQNASNSHAIEVAMDVSNSTEGYMSADNTLTIKPIVTGWEKAGNYKTSMYVSLYPR